MPVAPMSSRQRLLAAGRCEAVDRVPVSPFGLGRLDPEGPDAAALIAECDPFLEAWMGVNFFGGRAFREETVEEGNLLRGTIHTPKGPLTRTVKRTEVARHLIEFPCKGAADLEKYLSIPWEEPAPDAGPYLRLRERAGEGALALAGCPDGICMPAELLSPQDFCLLWADEPGFMAEAVAEAARRVEAVVEAACRAGVRGFRIIGGEYASVQLGPRAFDELVVEHDRRLVDIMHRHGALAYYHNHGPIMRYLEPIAAIGVDYLDPLEVPPFGDADLARAADIIDGRYCVVGTFDDMEVLEKWPLARLKEAAREHLRLFGRRGLCLGGSASGTYTARAARAFRAMVEVAGEGL
jgi:hypothetical protein